MGRPGGKRTSMIRRRKVETNEKKKIFGAGGPVFRDPDAGSTGAGSKIQKCLEETESKRILL